MRIATGQIEDTTTEDGKNAAAVALGRMGGKARAEGLSATRPSRESAGLTKNLKFQTETLPRADSRRGLRPEESNRDARGYSPGGGSSTMRSQRRRPAISWARSTAFGVGQGLVGMEEVVLDRHGR